MFQPLFDAILKLLLWETGNNKRRFVMLKMSALAKCTLISILLALVVSSFPTTSVFAGANTNLVNKWEQLVTRYNNQTVKHDGVHNAVDHWLVVNKNARLSEKAEIRKHLAICNYAIYAAGIIVNNHTGFDAKGNVVDRASALKSIKDLSYYLQQHSGSVKNLHEHTSN
jgi:hypothetical protein